MAYDAATVANYFLDRASREGRAVTPMQLIKLVYIAHGWHLGYFDEPLINETVQAWRYGPVVKSLYDKIKHYGRGAVQEPIRPMLWSVSSAGWDEDTQLLLDNVWKNYAGFSGVELSSMTHQKDTPWWKAWVDQGGRHEYFAEIEDSLIKQHYRKKIEEQQDAEHVV